jgi:hypothetical protein
MNQQIQELWRDCVIKHTKDPMNWQLVADEFAQLIALECIDKIETYRIPVGNSASGELACEWTYQALLEIRDEIQQHFGIEP